MSTLIVLRLVDEALDGAWMECHGAAVETLVSAGEEIPLSATGDVEWDDDWIDGPRCAEVYVPTEQLSKWRCLRAIEATASDA